MWAPPPGDGRTFRFGPFGSAPVLLPWCPPRRPGRPFGSRTPGAARPPPGPRRPTLWLRSMLHTSPIPSAPPDRPAPHRIERREGDEREVQALRPPCPPRRPRSPAIGPSGHRHRHRQALFAPGPLHLHWPDGVRTPAWSRSRRRTRPPDRLIPRCPTDSSALAPPLTTIGAIPGPPPPLRSRAPMLVPLAPPLARGTPERASRHGSEVAAAIRERSGGPSSSWATAPRSPGCGHWASPAS